MEMLPRITRRMAHKLLKEKSLPNRLQRFVTGGFKRKADFLSLTRKKRRRTQNQESTRSALPSVDVKSEEDDGFRAENGKSSCSDSGDSSFCSGEVKIVVELPVTGQTLSPETLKIAAEVSKLEDPEKDYGGSDGDCENVYGGFQGFHLNLVYDTDSEEQTSWNFGEKGSKDHQEVVTSKSSGFQEEGNRVQADVVLLERDTKDVGVAKEEGDSDVMVVKDGSKIDDGGSGLVCKKKHGVVKREKLGRLGPGSRWLYSGSRFASFLRSSAGEIDIGDLENLMQDGRKGASKLDGRNVTGTPPKQHVSRMPGKRKVAISPNSQLKLLEASKSSSYRRMLPFCNELAKDLAKASSAQSITKMPSREEFIARKECDIHLDEGLSKGLLPLEHIKSDDNVTESSLGTINQDLSGEVKSIANIELEQNGIQREFLSVRKESQCTGHVEIAQNDSQREVSSAGEDTRMEPPSIEHANLEENETRIELLPNCTETLKEPLLTKCVKLKENMNQAESAFSNGLDSTNLPTVHVKFEGDASQLKSAHSDQFPCIEHANLEKNICCIKFLPNNTQMLKEALLTKCVKHEENMNQAESVIGNAMDSTNLPTVHVKLEENASQLKPAHNDQFLCTEHANLEENESCMKLLPNNKEILKVPLPTKYVKLKENMNQAESANSNGLDSTNLPTVHVKLEEDASQLKSAQSDQFLSRKSLFLEHVQPKQNELQPEKTITDHSLPKTSFSSECAEPEQAECQAESPSIQADSSTACYPNDSTDLGINVVSELSNNALLTFSSGKYISPVQMHKPSTVESDSMALVEHKSPPPSLPGAANSTYYPTYVDDRSPLHTPASVPSKGILKMIPCPCRGVCMCSDCVSFRLQAERASEFSQRQLREVEVLAVTLMNELAHARNVMEKSLVAKPKGARFPAPVSPTEVKEATKSALKAEETARSQLVQMTRDCNLHCKILRMQQRRVKFADKIEVKLFKS